jgi:hypothetical protein
MQGSKRQCRMEAQPRLRTPACRRSAASSAVPGVVFRSPHTTTTSARAAAGPSSNAAYTRAVGSLHVELTPFSFYMGHHYSGRTWHSRMTPPPSSSAAILSASARRAAVPRANTPCASATAASDAPAACADDRGWCCHSARSFAAIHENFLYKTERVRGGAERNASTASV